MEFIHTINSHLNNGTKAYRDRISYFNKYDINSYRIALKSLDVEEINRIERLLYILIEEHKNINKLKIYLDIPYPGKKYRLHCRDGRKISNGDIIYIKKKGSGKGDCYVEDSFFDSIDKGAETFIYGDGEGMLKVVYIEEEEIKVKAQNDFILYNSKSIHVDGCIYSKTMDSELILLKNIIDKYDIYAILLSFCDSVESIKKIKRLLNFHNCVYAKIESYDGYKLIENIADVADGIIVARGDLGLNISYKDFYVIEDSIINIAKIKKCKIFVATGVLDSLTNCDVPDRAELFDFSYLLEKKIDGLFLSTKFGYNKKLEILERFMQRKEERNDNN